MPLNMHGNATCLQMPSQELAWTSHATGVLPSPAGATLCSDGVSLPLPTHPPAGPLTCVRADAVGTSLKAGSDLVLLSLRVREFSIWLKLRDGVPGALAGWLHASSPGLIGCRRGGRDGEETRNT